MAFSLAYEDPPERLGLNFPKGVAEGHATDPGAARGSMALEPDYRSTLLAPHTLPGTQNSIMCCVSTIIGWWQLTVLVVTDCSSLLGI